MNADLTPAPPQFSMEIPHSMISLGAVKRTSNVVYTKKKNAKKLILLTYNQSSTTSKRGKSGQVILRLARFLMNNAVNSKERLKSLSFLLS
jgi:hypothetical protein